MSAKGTVLPPTSANQANSQRCTRPDLSSCRVLNHNHSRRTEGQLGREHTCRCTRSGQPYATSSARTASREHANYQWSHTTWRHRSRSRRNPTGLTPSRGSNGEQKDTTHRLLEVPATPTNLSAHTLTERIWLTSNYFQLQSSEDEPCCR